MTALRLAWIAALLALSGCDAVPQPAMASVALLPIGIGFAALLTVALDRH